MLIKPIEYVDYNGNKRNETFYFNLTKAEVIEMEAERPNGLINYLNDLLISDSKKEFMDFFTDLIHRSYGVKTDDGRRFIKSEEKFEEFKQTEAYSELITELLSGEDKMSAFVTGIIPKVE